MVRAFNFIILLAFNFSKILKYSTYYALSTNFIIYLMIL